MAEAATSDTFVQVRGFQVDIDNAGGKDHDVAWEHVSGGELIIEMTETTVGSDKFHTHSPGHRSVGEITLRGAMTDKRAALCQWINATTKGEDFRRRVLITPIHLDGTPGPTYVFEECFITGYVFPRLDVSPEPCDGPLTEEVRFAYSRRRVVGNPPR